MRNILIFGLGYSASYIAKTARIRGWNVDATGSKGNIDFGDEDAVHRALAAASHVLSSVPPTHNVDPVLAKYGTQLDGKWLGYLSSTGVYGDSAGAWVDESAPTGTGRRKERSTADAAWLEIGAHVFRLPGIYGPGRSALDRVREGKAKRIIQEGQIFSRIHAEDIAGAVMAAIESGAPAGAYNIADDMPASQNAVIEEAARLLSQEPPKLQTLEEANLSEMARGFYAENRRVANGKAKRALGWMPKYPSYFEGLRGVIATTMPASVRPAPTSESSDHT